MKTYLKVMGGAVSAIAVFWVADAAVDSYLHYDESFVDCLIYNDKEVAFRSFFAVCFLAFSLIMARSIDRQKKAESRLIDEVEERRKIEGSLRDSLGERDLMMREIHHRIKNNFAVIQSLLGLQLREMADESARGSLTEARNRVKTMSMIHESLSHSTDISRMNFREFANSLAVYLYKGYEMDPATVRMEVKVPEMHLDVNVLMPCGLIVNELLSNAFKYAFPDGRKGNVTVELLEGEGDDATIVVKDDGVGLPEGIDLDKPDTLGLMIVASLAGQIHGKLEAIKGSGAEFRVTFSRRGPRQRIS